MPDAAAAATPLIEVRDLTRTYKRTRTSLRRPAPEVHALRGMSFDVRAGERFGIVGESGSGKSTLVRLLSALDSATSGSIRFDGEEIVGRSERSLRFLRRQLQIVFQDPMGSLDPRMKVRDIIAEPMLTQGYDQAARRQRVAELLEAVSLPASASGRFSHQFSGGQRQRISIARALSVQPKVLVADEAVSALDVSVRAQILNLIAELVDRYQLTLLFVSHDLSVIRHVCETVAVMNEGRLVELGPTEAIYEQPKDPYTQRLTAAAPSLERALERLRPPSAREASGP